MLNRRAKCKCMVSFKNNKFNINSTKRNCSQLKRSNSFSRGEFKSCRFSLSFLCILSPCRFSMSSLPVLSPCPFSLSFSDGFNCNYPPSESALNPLKLTSFERKYKSFLKILPRCIDFPSFLFCGWSDLSIQINTWNIFGPS